MTTTIDRGGFMHAFLHGAGAVVLLMLVGLLASCADRARAPGGVIVDMKGVDQAQYRTDLAECGAYADQVDASAKVAGQAAGGAVVGGAVGAIFGGGHGAAQGAGAGAVVGGARGVEDTLQERNQVVRTCLRNRGYSVLN
jgi:outer membrane lipoprotein SlyB